MLCESCALIDFEDVFYPREMEQGNGYSLLFKDRQQPDWCRILADGTTCTFCAFVVEALSMDEQYEAVKRIFLGEAPNNMANNVFLTANLLGTVSLPEHTDSRRTSHGWYASDGRLKRHARYLHVQLATSTAKHGLASSRASIFAAVNSEQSRAERVLRCRPLCSSPAALKRLVELWLVQCLFYHELCDCTAWTGITGVRMIDTVKMCIVPIEAHVDYIALSYCWGPPEAYAGVLKLTKATLPLLEQTGSIKNVGRTISDAIALAKLLMVRYLWVDMLCIVQDDLQAKDVQINQMDAIYKHAAITIIAAAGFDVHAGLPGVHRRRSSSKSSVVSGFALTARPDADKMGSVLARSIWSTRAWTLQEHLLSKRCLIFTEYEIFYECECAHFREGVQSEAGGDTQVLVHESLNHQLKPNKHDLTSVQHSRAMAETLSPFQQCCTLMNRFTMLRIGFEEDRLKAMTGILNDMSHAVPGGFWWGMPLAAFETGLCFAMSLHNDSYVETRRACFPSWSYLGWTTIAGIELGNEYEFEYGMTLEKRRPGKVSREKMPRWTTREVAFFRFEASEWREIDSIWIDREHSIFFEESRSRWEPVCRPMTDHTLAFWTQVVYLHVDMRREVELGIPGGEWAGRKLIVRDGNGRGICHLGLHTAYRHGLPQKLKFALIAQNRRFAGMMAPRFDLLHIETVDGISRRTGEVRNSVVTVDIWQDLKPQWELILLV